LLYNGALRRGTPEEMGEDRKEIEIRDYVAVHCSTPSFSDFFSMTRDTPVGNLSWKRKGTVNERIKSKERRRICRE